MFSDPGGHSTTKRHVLQDVCARHAVLVADAEGIIVAASESAMRQTGYTAAELVGRPLSDLYTLEGIAADLPAEILHEVGQRKARRLETWRRRKDGTRYPVSLLVVPTLDAHGAPVGLVELARDPNDPTRPIVRLKRDIEAAAALERVAELCHEAATLSEALRATLTILCLHLGWPVGHAYRVSRAGAVHSLDIWHFDDEDRLGWLREVTEATPKCPQGCVVADAASTKRPIWLDDPASEPRFRRPASPSGAASLTSGLVFPVMAGSEVVAVIELFSDGRSIDAERSLTVMSTVGHQIGLVSLRERAVRALRRSEARYAGIVRMSAECIVSVDADRLIAIFNPSAEAVFGYRSDEVMGRPFSVLLPEGERPPFPMRSSGTDRRGRAESAGTSLTPLRFRRKDGSVFPAEASVSEWEADGGPVATVVLRDITKRWRAERDLRALSDTGSVFAHAVDLIETIERVAGVVRTYLGDVGLVLLKDEMEGRTQLSLAEEPGHVETMVVASEDRERSPLYRAFETGQAVIEGLDGGRPLRLPSRLDGYGEGDVIPACSWLLVPIRASGRCHGVLGLVSLHPELGYGVEDLTVAEELARRTALAIEAVDLYRRFERAAHIQDEVLAMVAHDLGRPASSIAMVLDRLLKSPREEDRRHRSRGYLEGMRRSASQMQRLIDDLLDVRRIETGRFAVEPALQPLSPIVAAAVEQVRLAEERPDVVIELDVPETLQVHADAQRVVQLLSNLLGNALRFSPTGGSISIRARREGDEVVTAVRDQGPGISPERLPTLFDRFAARGGPRAHGTGLGLTIAREIAAAHGGRIWVDTEVGAGSTFLFSLPDRAEA
jgi:PAS domain S-box-containing protein